MSGVVTTQSLLAVFLLSSLDPDHERPLAGPAPLRLLHQPGLSVLRGLVPGLLHLGLLHLVTVFVTLKVSLIVLFLIRKIIGLLGFLKKIPLT